MIGVEAILGARVVARLEPRPDAVATTTDGEGRYRIVLDLPTGISEWAPLSAEEVADEEDATCGYSVQVTAKPGLLPGLNA